MKKETSFLLALVMLVSMLPTTAVPVAAAESTGTLNAYYTHGTVKVDGKLDDGRWLLNEAVGSTPAALLCDQENLYLALQTGADSAELTLNGVTAKVDLAAIRRDTTVLWRMLKDMNEPEGTKPSRPQGSIDAPVFKRAPGAWKCSCGQANTATDQFCKNCGKYK